MMLLIDQQMSSREQVLKLQGDTEGLVCILKGH